MTPKAAAPSRGRDTLALVLAEHERFAAFLRRRLSDAASAEDVLQAAYAKVLARDAGPRDRARVVAWFFRVLRRALLDEMRRRDAARRGLAKRAAETPPSAAEDAALRSEVCECVNALLPSLEPAQADLLRRIEVEGASVREVAARLGITANAAAVRVHRARAALSRRLRELCGACTAHGCLRCTCRRGRRDP